MSPAAPRDLARSGIPPTRRNLLAHGRVQGVGFRDSTRREAEDAGVNGWVRNQPDGTVRMLLVGPKEGVDQVLGRIRARFDCRFTDIVPHGVDSDDEFPAFRILRD